MKYMFNKTNNEFFAKRLDDFNIRDYLFSLDSGIDQVEVVDQKLLPVDPLLQNNYGEDSDCTLTCITTCLYYLSKRQHLQLSIPLIYKGVEQIAKKYFYNGKIYGTIPFFTKKIFDEALSSFGLKQNTVAKYGKIIGYDDKTIKNAIDDGKPVILSLTNDGRSYYKHHSITICGYADFKICHKKENIGLNKTMFMVYDNWDARIAYVDFNEISLISSINY